MNSNDIPEVARQAVVRHELTHAFLYESGMECFDDEIIVEWVARLFPKLFCAFVDAGAVTVALDGATVVTGGLNAGQVNNLPGKSQNSKQDEIWRAGEDPTFIASLCDYIKTACKLQHGEALIADPTLTELIRQELLCFVGMLEGDYKTIHSDWSWMYASQNLAERSYASKRASSAIKSVLKRMEPLDGLKLTDEDVATALKIMSNKPAKPASKPGEMPFFPENFEISEYQRQKLFPSVEAFEAQMQKVAKMEIPKPEEPEKSEKVEISEVQDPAPNLDPLNELAATVSMAVCQLESAKVLLAQVNDCSSSCAARRIEENLHDAMQVIKALKYKIDREVTIRD